MRICFFGDSFVNGTGDPEFLGWTGRLCAAGRAMGCDLTHYNLGVRRDTSADVRARWADEAERRQPPGHLEYDPRLVFSFGVNDTAGTSSISTAGSATRIRPEDSLENLRAILDAASPRCPVLFVGPPPVADPDHNSRIAELDSRFADACADLGVPYLPVFAALGKSAEWTREVAAGDGSHPGAGGYTALARLVEAWHSWASWLRAA